METEDHHDEVTESFLVEHEYSPFWPLAICIFGLFVWIGYQITMSYIEGSSLRTELANAQPEITKARNSRARLYSLAQDLVTTAAKDPYAAQIAKEAGLQAKPATSAAPTDSTAGH